MTSGYCSGTLRSSAASIITARSAMYCLKSKPPLFLAAAAGAAAEEEADADAAAGGRTVTSATQLGRCREAGSRGMSAHVLMFESSNT